MAVRSAFRLVSLPLCKLVEILINTVDPANTPIIDITMISSTKVNPDLVFRIPITLYIFFVLLVSLVLQTDAEFVFSSFRINRVHIFPAFVREGVDR